MKVLVILGIVCLIFSCKENAGIDRSYLLGRWSGKSDHYSIELIFEKDSLIQILNDDSIISSTKQYYSLVGDTLIVYFKNSIEKHRVVRKSNAELILEPEFPNDKIAPAIDLIPLDKFIE